MDKEEAIRMCMGNFYIPKTMPKCPTSHICTICGTYEYPESDVCTTELWLCQECVNRIKRMIYKGNDNG